MKEKALLVLEQALLGPYGRSVHRRVRLLVDQVEDPAGRRRVITLQTLVHPITPTDAPTDQIELSESDALALAQLLTIAAGDDP